MDREKSSEKLAGDNQKDKFTVLVTKQIDATISLFIFSKRIYRIL